MSHLWVSFVSAFVSDIVLTKEQVYLIFQKYYPYYNIKMQR